MQLIQNVTHKLEEVSPTPSWQNGADSGQMSTYINILRHFMLFYACNRDDDKKNPYISFLGYSGRLVPKTEKRGDASPVTEKKGKFRNANIWQRSQKKGKDHLFQKKNQTIYV